jgi:predicted CDP-diglyceride synthetase/phosphatidate cytidylyltransferase
VHVNNFYLFLVNIIHEYYTLVCVRQLKHSISTTYSYIPRQVVHMGFGDWEMFRMVIISLREHELSSVMQLEETSANRNVRFAQNRETSQERSKSK